MPGLLCQTRLLSCHLVADRARRLALRRYSLAPREILTSGKCYSIQQWLPDQNQVVDDDDDEDDLADMVHDFIENGSETWRRNNCFRFIIDSGSDSDSNSESSSLVPSCCESLQAMMEAMVPEENEITSHLTKLVLNAGELDLQCHGENDCNGGCLNLLAKKHLQMLGYQASICRSKWQSNGKHPGGEYEFISVNLKRGEEKKVIVVDLDFRSQFEIARPVTHYRKALRQLPLIFVGGEGRLDWVLRVMSDAARGSLHQTCMPFPPWRTLHYLRAKWLRPTTSDPAPLPESVPFPPSHCLCHGHCRAQLNCLKQEVAEAQKAQTSVDITDRRCNKPSTC